AASYGMDGVSVDGNDATAVFEATWAAREKALAGGGPTLIEAKTLRMHGHGAHDDASYIPAELLEEWGGRDPIERLAARLEADELTAIEAEVKAEIDLAVEAALATPMPDPATATEGVCCSGPPEVLGEGAAPWSGFATTGAVPAAA
ncbi:MAG TPA: thiamine pyrophosphate-dependent enzyme, partial [Solirubrobacterales bacterium]|nr:thiamine pyrophosphate-dependent enzyme [Solirubrobacterales bacterium]